MLGRIRQLASWARTERPDVALSHNSYAQIVAARADAASTRSPPWTTSTSPRITWPSGSRIRCCCRRRSRQAACAARGDRAQAAPLCGLEGGDLSRRLRAGSRGPGGGGRRAGSRRRGRGRADPPVRRALPPVRQPPVRRGAAEGLQRLPCSVRGPRAPARSARGDLRRSRCRTWSFPSAPSTRAR